MLMRAKLKVAHVHPWEGNTGETLTFLAVGKNEAYPEDGSDENNTYARFTPMAELKMAIQNPALLGKISVDQEFYVDFTPVNSAQA